MYTRIIQILLIFCLKNLRNIFTILIILESNLNISNIY